MPARRLLTAAAVALATAVPAAAAAAPAGPVRLAGTTEVPVERGTARFRPSPDLRTALRANGVVLARIGAERRGAARRSSGGFTLRLTGGAVTSGGGKLGGELRFGRAGMALIRNGTPRRTVRLTRIEVNLGQGVLTAARPNGTRITVGTFRRPATDSALDVRTRTVRMNLVIRATPAVEGFDAALGTRAFAAGRSLLHARIVARLDRTADLRTALNLGRSGRPAD
ncbi:hypothetical protein [Streptomyces sp. NPDC020742]|uniref:hypothetical protein n=1 Tax=unclassified Streptomyces TaxID=2593676 RepID=UPI0033FD9060